jgi:hypothetical protein
LTTSRTGRTFLWGVAAISAIAFLGGCSEEDSDEPSGPRTISEKEIDEADRGSPERATLEWWREVQFQNAGGAAERYAAEADVDVEGLNRQVSVAQSSFAGVPEVVDVTREGDLATVYLTIAPPSSDAPPRNVSVNLVEVDGQWLLRDNLLMEQAVARVARAQAAAAAEDPE